MTVDCILVSCSALAVDESHLTGESEDIRKDPATNPVLYSGSKIMQGVGRALVVAVGENSQVGLLTKLMTGGGEGPAAASQSSSSQNGLRKQTVLAGKLEKLAEDIGRFGLGAAALSLGVMASKFTYRSGHSFCLRSLGRSRMFLRCWMRRMWNMKLEEGEICR